MRLADLVATSVAVAETSSRLDKTARLAELLSRLAPDEVPIAIAFLSGSTPQGRVGVGGTLIASARDVSATDEPTLTLVEVSAALDAIKATAGEGSASARLALLRGVFSRATLAEQDFLVRLLFGDLRQGALEGVLTDAVARAAGLPPADIRRAAMFAGGLAPVAAAALAAGRDGMAQFAIEPFRPLQPMLADSASDVDDALRELGEASFEHKLDGARIQAHKVDDEVRIFTRNLRDVSASVPEVVEIVRALPARAAILDGETLARRPDGAPHPFQITMRRFGRKLDVDELRRTVPLTASFFDLVYLDGQSLADEPLVRRVAALADLASSDYRVPRIVTADPARAAEFARQAIEAGHEGVMAKALSAPYAAGRRGQAWLKIKKARTLDLVILAAEWGSGRRRGTLSNVHLGARDAERGGYVMLGKTFKGLTDELLKWQTNRFLALEMARDGQTVFVRPEVVAEIAFNEIQESPQYPGGLTLRFARVKGYRPDKTGAEADTFGMVQQLYRQITGLEPPPRR